MNQTRLTCATVLAVCFFSSMPTNAADEKSLPSALEASESATVSATVSATDEQLRFVKEKVLPLLEARCFECHKASAEPKGSLVLSGRKAMLIGGDSGPAIVPGKPDESILMEAVRYESFEMPPRSRMPEAEVAILEKWIADGAYWPEDMDAAPIENAEFPLEERRQSHWAWHPIASPKIPQVANPEWNKNAIDAFVMSRLQSAQIDAATEADRYTLIRRMYFDLIGVPPSIEQIEAFVNDSRDNETAMAKVIDELLQSIHFGERWGRHWLDLVRYADTLGHEFDYPLHNAWQYRDYVIRAINADLPYDDFIREHVAGDLLTQPRLHVMEGYNESVIATGFWYLCEDKHAPVDVKAEEAGKIDNQIDVFSKTFLGMTVACARCHDHKFDAISTKDYYALAGFLQSSRRQTAWLDRNHGISQRVQTLRNLSNDAGRLAASYAVSVDSNEELRKYALATLEVIRGEPIAPLSKTADEVVVFEDFEDEVLTDWEVSGMAFGKGTATGNFPGQGELTGRRGQRLVNSWNLSDGWKGKMRSPSFTIEKPGIRFLIGGGNHPKKTCVNLVVDGKAARTATGKNQETLLPHSWNVADLIGKTAHIDIIDQHAGGWGHVNVDHIEFCNTPTETGVRRDVRMVAKETNCDAPLLNAWVRALNDKSTTSPDNPLSLLATVAQSDIKATAASVFNNWKVTGSNEPAIDTKTTAFADLRNGLPDDWFHTGEAFSNLTEPNSNKQLTVEWRTTGLAVNDADGVSSATLSRELRGELSSPTFELSHPEILIRVAGEGCRVRLVIDGYLMNEFSELLFSGARQKIDTQGEDRWIRLAGDVHRYKGHRAHLEFLDEGDGWFAVKEVRFANTPGASPGPEPSNPVNISISKDQTAAGATNQQIVETWLKSAIAFPQPTTATLLSRSMLSSATSREWRSIAETWIHEATNVPKPFPVIAMTEGSPENEHVFIRGNHRNPGQVAERNILTALQTKLVPEMSGSGRLQLAEQLLADDNPLVARVAVNRIWHHLFGRGIVESTDNFGVLGKTPSHPELLDHLATAFQSHGWSTKQLIRSIMLSKTYRLSSERSEAAEAKDPTNTLLHRANIRRLQGEAVRDAILSVSGALSPDQFGSPMAVHLTAFMQGRGRPGNDGPLDGGGRRSIYIAVNRNFLSPFMQAFDVPPPVTTTGKRTTSNVPAQALIMLNNEFVNQQASRWASALLNSETSTPKVLAKAWYQLFGRPATESQVATLQAFAQGETATTVTELSPEVLTEICHALLNTKEFLFLN